MVKSAVYDGNSFIGEAEIYPENSNIGNWVREIRISHFSAPSERCPPLAVLRAITEGGICFKMEAILSPSMVGDSPLLALHMDCLRDNKTAVIPLGEEELHLVAMVSRKMSVPNACFWCFSVPKGLYVSSLSMLNLRCLGLVFDLDETLIVANTMRSFEDKIDALQRKMSTEPDGQRAAGMLAEIKRYQDDKYILKQFVDSDQIVDNGKVLKAQSEIVPPLSDSQQLIRRPVVRLQEKNIILTRVNPTIRDTSVLVRLRPAWEDLRSYLTAKGRKRFEVYVCTMAERDYALEMWRLLDPDSSLINSNKLLERIVCVKSGSRKSLLNVFQEGKCHPKMALVIDDRLKVWDEKDQPRVHVVPAFAPYYAPQAEAKNSTPVLCVARNVACNVRGGFFKDFDGGVLPQTSEVCYEDDMKDIPTAPDVGSYLVSEDEALTSNFSKVQLHLESMAEADRERILKDASNTIQAVEPMIPNLGPRTVTPLQHLMVPSSSASMMTAMPMVMSVPNNHSTQPATSVWPLNQLASPEHGFHNSTEEGEIQEPEMDPDARRRLLILQHGQDTRDLTSSFPTAPPVPIPPVQQPGLWFPLEQDINSRNPNRMDRDINLEPEFVPFERKRHRPPVFLDGDNIFVRSENCFRENRRFPMQLNHGVDIARSNNISSKSSFQGCELPVSCVSASHRADLTDLHVSQQSESVVGFLQKIALSLGTKVEFRSGLCHTTDLQFSVEVWFVSEKIGQAVGKTRKEAQHRAAEISLHNLAHKFLTNSHSSPNTLSKELLEPLQAKGNDFIGESNSYGYRFSDGDDVSPVASTSQDSRLFDQRLDASGRSTFVTLLKELCTMEGYSLVFQVQPSPLTASFGTREVSAQVLIGGQILGHGSGASWEEAKLKGAEEALGTLRSMLGQFTQNHANLERSFSIIPNKKPKTDFPRTLNRYSKTKPLCLESSHFVAMQLEPSFHK